MFADLTRAATHSFANAPWWAWPIGALSLLTLIIFTTWLAGRFLRSLWAQVRVAATGSAQQRDQVAAWVRARFMTLAFGAVVAIVIGLSAQTMVSWLREIGMSKFWATLGFVAFDGVATMLALTLWQRSRRGESTGMIRPALWTLVLIAAWLCSHKADGNFAAAVVYALFPIIAAVGLEYMLQESRRDRTWLQEQAGEKAKRRLALVRWMHPIERIQVQFELATDEEMGSAEATRRVRERAQERRQERVIRRVRTQVWKLRRDQDALARAGKLTRWVWARRVRSSESWAQQAIASAQMAQDTTMVTVILREMQMMTLADKFAGMDYSSAREARVAVANLITDEELTHKLELESAPADRRGSGPIVVEPTLAGRPTDDDDPDPTDGPDGPGGEGLEEELWVPESTDEIWERLGRPVNRPVSESAPTGVVSESRVWLPSSQAERFEHADTPQQSVLPVESPTDIRPTDEVLPFLNPDERTDPTDTMESDRSRVEVPRDDLELLGRVHQLVIAGELPLVLTRAQRAEGRTVPDRPAAEALRNAVGCGQSRSRRLRDAYPTYVVSLEEGVRAVG